MVFLVTSRTPHVCLEKIIMLSDDGPTASSSATAHVLGEAVVQEELPSSTTADYTDDLLALLSPPGEAMDFDWLFLEDENRTDDAPWSLRNVSAASRSLATAQSEQLCDQSSVSRSFALPTAVKTESAGLANMSAVSHNLANVGALPQCNQRHARAIAPVAVAEDAPHAVLVADLPPRPAEARTLLDLSTTQQPFHFGAQPSSTPAGTPSSSSSSVGPCKPRGRRLQRSATSDDQQKKLEMRRTKNREAAERMRRRRREETATLERAVKDLTERCHQLQARLDASEAENVQLRNLKQLVLAVATQPQPDDPAKSTIDPAASKLVADQVARLVPTEQQPAAN